MAGCTKPLAQSAAKRDIENAHENFIMEEKNMLLVGKKAPVFKAPAFYKGEFTEINLEDYKGQWVMLCFYPGDFTFV